MRVLMTTDTVGGVWTYSTELTAQLLQSGAAVALICIGRVPSSAQQQWLQRMTAIWGSNFLWEVSTAPLEWMSNNEDAYVEAEPLLTLVAREFGADLLHSNQFCFGALPFGLPKLVVAHSDVLSWAGACRNKPLESSPWLNRYYALTAAGLRGADIVVAPTHWMLGALAANFRLPSVTLVIANGRTVAGPHRGTKRKLQAVTAGRFWDEGKNLKLLTEVRSSFPILVAGETGYEANIPAMTMLGALEGEDLLALFRESAIYLCTSLYEPFGLAPLEAALCGCAVLINDIPSLREVWGDDALYFSDAASLSAWLAELSGNPPELAAAQRRSIRRARRYTAARMANEYLALYQTMVTKFEAATHVA